MKKFDALAKKQAKLEDKKKNLVKKSMETMNPETLTDVLEIVKKFGHPSEKKLSEEIENKYFSGEELGFNDLMNLDSLYKSNFEKFSKKDDDNE
ncbi:hypothetical protein LI187_12980 [bacterium 210820-DFI.6.38]|nr:hypothetical protein [bacterium 210820-DFI.6.38]